VTGQAVEVVRAPRRREAAGRGADRDDRRTLLHCEGAPAHRRRADRHDVACPRVDVLAVEDEPDATGRDEVELLLPALGFVVLPDE
jgi:hypothetical protein